MNVKKIISTGLCILTISSSIAFPISAARSADLSNTQIVNKVEQFNNSKLKKLDYYIWKINTKNFITGDLISLYQKLDSLVVYDINIANELNKPASQYHKSLEIGSLLEYLFDFLEIIEKPYTQDTFTAEMRATSIIKSLSKKIDQINISKNSEGLNFKSKQEKIDHMIAYLHYVIPYRFKNLGIDLANKINKTFEDKTYKDDSARKLHITLYILCKFQNEHEHLGKSILTELNRTFA